MVNCFSRELEANFKINNFDLKYLFLSDYNDLKLI